MHRSSVRSDAVAARRSSAPVSDALSAGSPLGAGLRHLAFARAWLAARRDLREQLGRRFGDVIEYPFVKGLDDYP